MTSQTIENINNSNISGANIIGNVIDTNIAGSEMHHRKRKLYAIHTILILIDVIILTISIVILCNLLPREVHYDMDYLGVIVGILSILVTTLVCWNVYSLIDFKQKERRLEESSASLNRMIAEVNYLQNNISTLTEYSFVNIYEYLLLGKLRPGLEYHLLNHGINATAYAMRNNDTQTASSIIKVLDEMLVEPQKILLPRQYKESLLYIATKIHHSEQIPKFSNLIESIAKISIDN